MLRLLSKNHKYLVAQKKFYDLIAEQKTSVQLPKYPEEAMLSQYIEKTQKQMIKEDYQNRSFVSWKKQKNTIQKNFSYQSALNSNPYGSVQKLQYKKHNITLLATNYGKINEKQLHKFMYLNKPDALLVQRRPQYYLHQFQILKKGQDGVFSDRKYLQQLKITPQTLNFDQNTNKITMPLDKALNMRRNQILQQYPGKEVLHPAGFKICKEYAQNYSHLDLYLSEIPMRSYKQWLANKNTLMQLQQMFQNVCKRLPRYKNYAFSPYQLSSILYPDTFIKINDFYMATLIQMLISLKKYKNIVGVFGMVQNKAVKNYLQNGDSMEKSMIQLLIPPGPKGNLIRDIENFQIIEKHILLDVFFYGDQITDIETKYLHVTNAVINKYSKDKNNSLDRETLIKFRYDKTMQYLKIMGQKYQQGQQQIKKQFVRQTLRRQKQ